MTIHDRLITRHGKERLAVANSWGILLKTVMWITMVPIKYNCLTNKVMIDRIFVVLFHNTL